MATGKAQVVQALLSGLKNASGTALSGGKVYTYDAGTTNNKTTWTDADKSTPAANPVILDSSGVAQIFADGNYKFRVDTSADATVYTWDNLSFRATESAWASWSPTYGAQTGTWPATTRIARYHRVGDGCFVEIYADGTTSGTPTYLTFTLPFAAVTSSYEKYAPCFTQQNGTSDMGVIIIPSSGSTAQVYLRNFAAWGAGVNRYIFGNFFYEI